MVRMFFPRLFKTALSREIIPVGQRSAKLFGSEERDKVMQGNPSVFVSRGVKDQDVVHAE